MYTLPSLFASKPTSTVPDDLVLTTPSVDLIDRGSEVVLYADLPGVDAKHLEVTVDGNRLTLRGTTPNSDQPEPTRSRRTYARSFALGETIDTEHISAQIRDGIATVRLPLRASAAPRKVPVA